MTLSWEEVKTEIDNQRWEVSVSQWSTFIQVEAHRGGIIHRDSWGCSPGTWFIEPPGILDRLFGRTYEQKVDRAIRKCQKYCDKQNRIEEYAKLRRLEHGRYCSCQKCRKDD